MQGGGVVIIVVIIVLWPGNNIRQERLFYKGVLEGEWDGGAFHPRHREEWGYGRIVVEEVC
jgi:hypothetical protein